MLGVDGFTTDASLSGIGMEFLEMRGTSSHKHQPRSMPYVGTPAGRAYASLWPRALPRDMMTVEAVAALHALRRWAPRLAGRRVWLQLDNFALVFAISKGSSRHPRCNALVRDILFTAASFDIQVYPYHVATESNTGPDSLSRVQEGVSPGAQAVCLEPVHWMQWWPAGHSKPWQNQRLH